MGRATALRLEAAGYEVFATVRKQEDADCLRDESLGRLCPLILDITLPEQIEAAVATLSAKLGDRGLGGLVNNAGICEAGPLELMSMERIRRQFEVNFFGHVMITQAVLPLLRQYKGARIVNIGSAVAHSPIPTLGIYSATKCAMRNFSLALRRELRWWDIAVSVIEPGFISAAIWDDVPRLREQIRREDPTRLYGDFVDVIFNMVAPSERIAVSPDRVAKLVKKIFEVRWPRADYPVGPGSILARWGNTFPEPLIHWGFERLVNRHRAQQRSANESAPADATV